VYDLNSEAAKGREIHHRLLLFSADPAPVRSTDFT